MLSYPMRVLCLAFGCFALFAWLCAHRRDPAAAKAAAVSLPLCAVLGFLCAKAGYILLMETGPILRWLEWSGAISLRPDTFCFTCGGIGVWLGLLLSARIFGLRPAGRLTDLFTVPGALLCAGLRWMERTLGNLGTGRYIATEAGGRPPLFSVVNAFGEAHVAVFALEAVWALAVAALAVTDRVSRPGARFERAIFRLCAGQILFESMRARALSWGFVRVEQLLCAGILLALMMLACGPGDKKQGAVRTLPVWGLLLCFAAVVGLEFLRYRSPSRFIGETGAWGMTAVVLLAAMLLYRRVTADPPRSR